MRRSQLGRHDAAFLMKTERDAVLSMKTESDAVFLIRMDRERYVGFNYKWQGEQFCVLIEEND